MEKTRKALQAARKLIDSAHKKGLVSKLGTGGDLILITDREIKLLSKLKSAVKDDKLEEAKKINEQLKKLYKELGKTYGPIGNYPTKL